MLIIMVFIYKTYSLIAFKMLSNILIHYVFLIFHLVLL